MNIGDRIFQQMKTFMDYSTRKQKVITSNLANVETPGYKAKDIDFKEYLKNETDKSLSMTVANPGHLKGVPHLKRIEFTDRENKDSMGPDGNNVDLEKEMTHMAQNVLKFTVVSQMFHQKIMTIRSSIREGKG